MEVITTTGHFDNGLKNKGVSAGCCTWSELCHPEYPQK